MKFAIFSPEMKPSARLVVVLAELYIGKYVSDPYARKKTEMPPDQLQAALIWVEKHFFIVNPRSSDNEAWSPDNKMLTPKSYKNIFKYFEYLKQTHDIFGYILDNYSTTEMDEKTTAFNTELIKKQIDWTTEFNEETGLCGIIVVHTTKLKILRSGNFGKITLYDASGSAHFKNKTDFTIIVERDRYKISELEDGTIEKDVNGFDVYKIDTTLPTRITIDDLRFQEIGSEGTIALTMQKSKAGRFEEFNSREKQSSTQEEDTQEEEEGKFAEFEVNGQTVEILQEDLPW